MPLQARGDNGLGEFGHEKDGFGAEEVWMEQVSFLAVAVSGNKRNFLRKLVEREQCWSCRGVGECSQNTDG